MKILSKENGVPTVVMYFNWRPLDWKTCALLIELWQTIVCWYSPNTPQLPEFQCRVDRGHINLSINLKDRTHA